MDSKDHSVTESQPPARRTSISTHSSGEVMGGAAEGLSTSGPSRRISRLQRRQSSIMAPGIGPRYSLVPGAFRSHAMALAILRERHAQKDQKRANTYKLDPDNDQRFQQHTVQQVIKEVLDTHCEDERYEASSAGMLTRTLTDIIKSRVKDLNYSRHKIIVHVVLGSINSQGFEMASRCLWNTQHDTFASATYQNNSLFAVATVYGCYFE